ncbi:hypothetical protein SGLAM104S_05087 [Streptomyces glaucescens]
MVLTPLASGTAARPWPPGSERAQLVRRPHALPRRPRPLSRSGRSQRRPPDARPPPSTRSRWRCASGRSRRPSAMRPRREVSAGAPPTGSSGPRGRRAAAARAGPARRRNQPTFTTCPVRGTFRGTTGHWSGLTVIRVIRPHSGSRTAASAGSSAWRSRERGHQAPSSKAGAEPVGASERRGEGASPPSDVAGREMVAVMTRTLPRAGRNRPGVLDHRGRHRHGGRCRRALDNCSILLPHGVWSGSRFVSGRAVDASAVTSARWRRRRRPRGPRCR